MRIATEGERRAVLAEELCIEREFIETPWNGFNRQFRGLVRGGVTVVAARPSMGKSAMAEQIAIDVAGRQGMSVGFCGYEMGPAGHCIRIAKRISHEIGSLELAKLRMDECDITWLEPANATVEALKACLLGPCEERSLPDLIVVDYIQEVTTDKKIADRRGQLASVMSRLQSMVKKCHYPALLIVSQMNRGIENQNNKRSNPLMSDLEGSGAIEQKADLIVMPVRKSILEGTASPPIEDVTVYVPKNRHGPTGQVRMTWTGETTSFSDGEFS